LSTGGVQKVVRVFEIISTDAARSIDGQAQQGPNQSNSTDRNATGQR